MDRMLPLLLLLLAAGCARTAPRDDGSALRTYPAADERIAVMGRHVVEDDTTVRFAASGVTFYVAFEGTELTAELEDEHRDGGYNWFTVVVDGGEPRRFRTEPGTRHYTLAEGLTPGRHTATLSKATEGQNGVNRLVAVHTQRLLPPEPLPERRIEFIGDSITSGFGLDARPVVCGDGTWFDQTHAWLAYGPRLARRLDAQWMLSSVSGIGMHRNWNSPGPVMPHVYGGVDMGYADTSATWSFDRYAPDLVVIALGTNDFSAGGGETPRAELDGDAFVQAYSGFVARLRRTYPDAPMLLLTSPALDASQNAELHRYLQRVVDARRAAGDAAVTTYAFRDRYVGGCTGHPDLEEHTAIADELEPVVRTITGW